MNCFAGVELTRLGGGGGARSPAYGPGCVPVTPYIMLAMQGDFTSSSCSMPPCS